MGLRRSIAILLGLRDEVHSAHPNGHFYSPVCNPHELWERQDEIWRQPLAPVLGVDFNDAMHLTILREWFPRQLPAYDYPEQGSADEALTHYYTANSQFGWLDSRALFVFMRELRPRRIVEVGSGYSSMLMADVNQRFLDGACEIRCIEPYPRAFLQRGVPGIREVIVQPVQRVPMTVYERLQAGDFLFIDSSHVCKTGSDVNHLFFEVLPRLAPGVLIHIHDIPLPNEYKPEWAIQENRSWNELYLLRALLMYSTAFETVFGCDYAYTRFPDAVRTALALPNGAAFGGGSYWIRRLAPR